MKFITKLLNEVNNQITDADEIVKYEETFYKNLYSRPNKDLNESQEEEVAANTSKHKAIPKINDTDKLTCNGVTCKLTCNRHNISRYRNSS